MVGALETSAPPKGTSQHLNTSTSQPTISVVIVDDDRLQGQLLNEMLRRIDGVQFDITTTIHADEAIKIAVEKNPHIVFTDIEMPEMNGSEIMRRIRNASSATSATDKPVLRTKFVAMTAHEQSIMPQLRSDGFDACLFKPFSVQTLAATICQLTGIAVRVSEKRQLKTQHSTLNIAGEAENNSKLKTQNSCSGKRLYEPSAKLTIAGEAENNSKLKTQNSKLKSALLPFTDGDPEAEAQIIGDIRKSIEEYLEMIGDGSDPERIAKAAHKAMPLLEMLEPGKNQWLASLQGVHLSPLGFSRLPEQEVHQQNKLQVHHQQTQPDSLVGALETSAPPNKQQTAPPNEQERERLTKQLIEKLKEILCDIY